MARRVTASLVLLLSLSAVALATPLTPHTLSAYFANNPAGPHGRNIRNLECVSRKTQEKGICMFALSCLKLNGTHLGVCVDRFYYGSCCKMPESQLEVDLGGGDTNEISPGPSIPLVTAASVVEEELPSSTTKKPEVTTKKPEITTKRPVTTAKPAQVTNKPVSQATAKPPVTAKPVVTAKPSVTSKPPVTTKPVSATTKPPRTTVKPPVQATTQKATTPKPASVTTSKPVPVTTKKPATKPTSSPTQKPQAATTAKPVIKPTNTTARPTKPPTSNKPAVATKPTVKPVTATKPTTKPVVVTTPQPSPPTTVSNEVKPPVRPESPDGPIVEAVEAEEEQTNVVGSTAGTTVKPTPTTEKPTPSTAKPSPSTVKPTRPTPPTFAPSTARPTPPTFAPTTARPTPPTFPRPSSTSEKPAVTTVAVTSAPTTPSTPTSTEDEWVQIEVSTSQSSPGSVVTEEIPIGTRPSSTSSPLPSSTTLAPHIDIDQNLNMSDYKQVCGRRLFPESRIVGGTRTAFGKWPWQISLRQWRTSTYLHKCGAALLNENWAITAAHCVENVPPSDLLLRLGEHDLSTESEPYSHLERRVQIVASHPQFDSRTFEYDLALLRFYEPVEFKPNVVPICIPDTDRNFVGSNAFVTGWGRLYEDGPLPSVMQEVSVPVLENAACETMYRSAGYIEHIPNIFICAGWKKGGFDSCEGDSGGPMVIQRDDHRWVLAGVISWGIGCAEPNQPGVYTRISEFRDWINQILQF